jgi:hypothetical protein
MKSPRNYMEKLSILEISQKKKPAHWRAKSVIQFLEKG